MVPTTGPPERSAQVVSMGPDKAKRSLFGPDYVYIKNEPHTLGGSAFWGSSGAVVDGCGTGSARLAHELGGRRTHVGAGYGTLMGGGQFG